MIIFNIDALILLILIIPLSYLTSSINPEFSSIGHPVNLGVIIFSSVIAEGISLKPKLFYLPTWLLFSIILIYTTFSNYGLINGLIAVVFTVLMLAVAYFIKMFFFKKKWKEAKGSLEYFLKNKNISPDKLICYPDYIYANSPFYEKNLDLMYVFFQKNWFNRPEVKNHYLAIIEELNKRNTTEKYMKQNKHLKHLLDNNLKYGIDEFMFDNLAKNPGFSVVS